MIVATSGERSTGPGQTGEVYIIFGNNATSDATFDLTSLDGSNGFVISGDQYVGGFGWGGAKAIGDNNGDQIDDIVIGAPYIDSNDISGSGESYVIFGSNAGFTDRIELSSLDGINGYKIYGAGSNDFLGYSVDGAGDINGDGIEDIVVGATYGLSLIHI